MTEHARVANGTRTCDHRDHNFINGYGSTDTSAWQFELVYGITLPRWWRTTRSARNARSGNSGPGSREARRSGPPVNRSLMPIVRAKAWLYEPGLRMVRWSATVSQLALLPGLKAR